MYFSQSSLSRRSQLCSHIVYLAWFSLNTRTRITVYKVTQHKNHKLPNAVYVSAAIDSTFLSSKFIHFKRLSKTTTCVLMSCNVKSTCKTGVANTSQMSEYVLHLHAMRPMRQNQVIFSTLKWASCQKKLSKKIRKQFACTI